MSMRVSTIVAITVFVFLSTSCSISNNRNGLLTEGPPPQSLDLKASDLSPDGCLNLQLIQEQLAALPPGVVVREHTKSFQMASAAMDGKALPRLRNMTAEAAFASFVFEERRVSTLAESLPKVTQFKCQKVEISDPIAGTEVFSVAKNSTRETLHLEGSERLPDKDETPSAPLKERTYKLLGSREIEITVAGPKIDRCPDFKKAHTSSTRTLSLGLVSEMNQMAMNVSVDLLKKIAIAAAQMPEPLNGLISRAQGELVQPSADQLRLLKDIDLDSKIIACPFEATPPSGDEPPPPEEDGNPNPGPPPTPTPMN